MQEPRSRGGGGGVGREGGWAGRLGFGMDHRRVKGRRKKSREALVPPAPPSLRPQKYVKWFST